MEKKVDIVIIFTNLIIAGSIIFIGYQAFAAKETLTLTHKSLTLANETLIADHERSRREKTIDVITEWQKQMYVDLILKSTVRSLVNTLNENQIRDFWEQRELRIESGYMSWLKPIYKALNINEKPVLDSQNKIIIIKGNIVAKIRIILIQDLNSLELLAIAWRHNIVDQEIIEEEFRDIFSSLRTQFPYEAIRKISGTFPSIDLLRRKIEKNDSIKEGKDRIV